MTRSLPVQRINAGFSLFEIMVVVVILSLSILLVPPLFSGGLSSAKVKSTARDIALLLRKERSAAIVSREISAFSLDVESKTYRSGQQQRPAHIPDALSVAITTGHTLVDDENSGRIDFYPDGSSTGGRIMLKNDHRTAYVNIEWLTGKVTVHE